MKPTLIYSALALISLPLAHAGEPACIVAPAIAESVSATNAETKAYNPFSIDINAGTMGAGMSLGYRFSPGFRLRLRGTTLSYSENDIWTDSTAILRIHGDSISLLADYFPWEGSFYITAGLNLSESRMRCRTRLYRERGMACDKVIGGTKYSVYSGDHADISGKYSWNHVQPYIGIGYQDYLPCSRTFYYSIDLGLNIMGKGSLSASCTDNLFAHNPRTGAIEPATEQQLKGSIRNEARDFFKIADELYVYPVLQFALGAAF